MLFSLALVFIVGMLFGKIFELMKLPRLLGMLITGILLGPYVFDFLDEKILLISPELREFALIIILARAGMNLNLSELKKIGRPAILLCFIPACFEIIGVVLIAPPLLGISVLESVLLGSVIAAVSPAVIVPKMLNLMEKGYGRKKAIPQMIMACASVDDVFVIVIFSVFSTLLQTGEVNAVSFLQIPTSIVFGLFGGIILGVILTFIFNKIHIRDSGKIIIILSTAFVLTTFEDLLTGVIGFSGLLAVMSLGATIKLKKEILSKRLSDKFAKLWVGAEILLFVLVGATVNIEYALNSGVLVVILILSVLLFRILGVILAVVKTKFNKKERIFIAFSFIPKATVQAAIGGIPLAMGLGCGDIILTSAVVAILITAPLGAILIDKTYKKALTNENSN